MYMQLQEITISDNERWILTDYNANYKFGQYGYYTGIMLLKLSIGYYAILHYNKINVAIFGW